MNRFSCFLFAIVLCVGLGNSKLFERNLIQFRNSLGPENVLTVFFRLNKHDQGYHHLNQGQVYDLLFWDSFFSNKAYCALWQGNGRQKYHAYFLAYKTGGRHFDKKNFWDCREDGIYFTHAENPARNSNSESTLPQREEASAMKGTTVKEIASTEIETDSAKVCLELENGLDLVNVMLEQGVDSLDEDGMDLKETLAMLRKRVMQRNWP
ncbi:unnamed protein product [Brassica oleracea var. botrytis]|nr:unnamed protein product [Brassica oleracea]